jgi:hypothetical protein
MINPKSTMVFFEIQNRFVNRGFCAPVATTTTSAFVIAVSE